MSGWTLAVTLLGAVASSMLALWLAKSGWLPGPAQKEAEDV